MTLLLVFSCETTFLQKTLGRLRLEVVTKNILKNTVLKIISIYIKIKSMFYRHFSTWVKPLEYTK